jgi:hypothetical protein
LKLPMKQPSIFLFYPVKPIRNTYYILYITFRVENNLFSNLYAYRYVHIDNDAMCA